MYEAFKKIKISVGVCKMLYSMGTVATFSGNH